MQAAKYDVNNFLIASLYSFLKNRKLIWLHPNQNVECRNQIFGRFSFFNHFEWSNLKLTETALGTSFGWVEKSFGTRIKDWSLQCATVWQRFLIPTQKRDQLATITITSVVEAF